MHTFIILVLSIIFIVFFYNLKIVSSEILANPLFIVAFAALALMPLVSSTIRNFSLVVILAWFSKKSNFSAKVLALHFLFLQKKMFQLYFFHLKCLLLYLML